MSEGPRSGSTSAPRPRWSPGRDGVAPIGTETPWMPSLVGYGDVPVVVGEEAAYLPEDQIVRSIKRAITENRAVRARGHANGDQGRPGR